MRGSSLAGHIQHTLYKVGTGPADVRKHCAECVEYGFAAAMVPARFVALAVRELAGTGIPVATAVDFPFGLMTDEGRIAEARSVVVAGAQQIDVGAPVGLLDGDGSGDEEFRASIGQIVIAVAPVEVKVMLELPVLSAARAERAVRLTVEAGAQWLKNASSGAVGVATPADIAFLRDRAPANVRIKASGAIHTARQVADLLAAGADLVGTSSGVAIVTGAAGRDGDDGVGDY